MVFQLYSLRFCYPPSISKIPCFFGRMRTNRFCDVGSKSVIHCPWRGGAMPDLDMEPNTNSWDKNLRYIIYSAMWFCLRISAVRVANQR
jgi:hypothetical protein